MGLTERQMQDLGFARRIIRNNPDDSKRQIVSKTYIHSSREDLYTEGKYVEGFCGKKFEEEWLALLSQRIRFDQDSVKKGFPEKLNKWDTAVWFSDVKDYQFDLHLISEIMKKRGTEDNDKIFCVVVKSEFVRRRYDAEERKGNLLCRELVKTVPMVIDLEKNLLLFLDSGHYRKNLEKQATTQPLIRQACEEFWDNHTTYTGNGVADLLPSNRSWLQWCCVKAEEETEQSISAKNVELFFGLVKGYDRYEFESTKKGDSGLQEESNTSGDRIELQNLRRHNSRDDLSTTRRSLESSSSANQLAGSPSSSQAATQGSPKPGLSNAVFYTFGLEGRRQVAEHKPLKLSPLQAAAALVIMESKHKHFAEYDSDSSCGSSSQTPLASSQAVAHGGSSSNVSQSSSGSGSSSQTSSLASSGSSSNVSQSSSREATGYMR